MLCPKNATERLSASTGAMTADVSFCHQGIRQASRRKNFTMRHTVGLKRSTREKDPRDDSPQRADFAPGSGTRLRRMPRFLLVMWVLVSGCAPTLRVTRLAPPQVSLGPARVVGLETRTQVGTNVSNTVLTGLVTGTLSVPVDIEQTLRERITARLPEIGLSACPSAPCGDATVHLNVVEASLGAKPVKDVLRAVARITVKVDVTRADGSNIYSDRFWDQESDRVEFGDQLLGRAADGIAGLLVNTFAPRQVTVEIPIEDGGPLQPGAELLLAGDLDGADRAFGELTTAQPGLAGAWYGLGVSAEARGDHARAAAMYRKAASLDGKRRYLDAAESAERTVQQSVAAAAARQAAP